MAEITKEDFLQNVAKHEMTVDYDNGINRRLVFANPKDYNQWFELVTWREHLCFSGDMGTFVFSRVEDMFDFFRRDGLSINESYWHEKLEAEDCACKSKKYSEELFRKTISELFEEWADENGVSGPRKAVAWKEVQEEILCHAEHELIAFQAADNFDGGTFGFEIADFFEVSLTEYTYQFLWCLYAIVWGIQQYDQLAEDQGDVCLSACEIFVKKGCKGTMGEKCRGAEGYIGTESEQLEQSGNKRGN